MKKLFWGIVSLLSINNFCIAQETKHSIPGNPELVSSKETLMALGALEKEVTENDQEEITALALIPQSNNEPTLLEITEPDITFEALSSQL